MERDYLGVDREFVGEAQEHLVDKINSGRFVRSDVVIRPNPGINGTSIFRYLYRKGIGYDYLKDSNLVFAKLDSNETEHLLEVNYIDFIIEEDDPEFDRGYDGWLGLLEARRIEQLSEGEKERAKREKADYDESWRRRKRCEVPFFGGQFIPSQPQTRVFS